jgi:hypothetical protein
MISLILTLALIGVVVWAITTYIPMPPVFKTAITIIAVVFVILYLMRVLGIGDIPVPRLR